MKKGATSGKQFTSNVMMGYWLFVKLPGVYVCGVVLFIVHLYGIRFNTNRYIFAVYLRPAHKHDPAVRTHDAVTQNYFA